MDVPHTHAEEKQTPQSTQTQKRQIVGDCDNDKAPPKRARLTRQNLAAFDKMGKNKTSNPTDGSSTTTKSTSTTTSGFALQARKNGILDPRSSKPPQNLEDLRERLARSRETASPPESAYDDYVDQVERAKNEATMVIKTSVRLLKEYPKGYDQAFNQAFTGIPKDVGFNNGLSAPQPDFIEGLEMEGYLPFPVDERICGAVLYKDDPHSLTLPHVAGEWKGPGKDMEEARMQAAYDGAALVYARNQALAYQGKSDPAGHAHITTFTTNGTQLSLYAHFATPAQDGILEYHQFPIKSTSLATSHGEHKDGYKHLRNAQDHARDQSCALKDELQDHWKQQRHAPHRIAEGTQLPDPHDTETVPTLPVPGTDPLHAYENKDDDEVAAHQPTHQPTPPTSSKHKSSKTNSHHSHATPYSPMAPPTTQTSTHNAGQKRKAPSSQGSSSGSSHHSKYRNYWTKDKTTGRFYHKHSDGTIAWLEEDGDDDDD
ncbi:hypothetical protein SPBR_02779 [Sporothrix brasiliensis 5110]|uniref:DUF7924 domain-containing protein n=1 Tax=Sporothrix brasiliensis 5110 TaxID=1398154 RepID=A0A0C2F1H8_9PEZI|nr:uncharacterized protein SPBR_02779 [Sporothrix brasiliensis 5110]KIH92779.1 hypothetical protein SPBR_02779 [Sporothrix brasiliensis 5110]